MLSTLSETFWILVLALVVLFAFFLVLGAFTPGDVGAMTVVVAVLAVLWVAHAVWDSRHRDPHDRSIIQARERRGF
jgi:fatty acid desaturase